METHDPEFLKKLAKIAHDEALDEAAKIKGSLYAPKEDIPKKFQKYRMMGGGDYATYARKCSESDGFDVRGCSGRLPGGISEIKSPTYALDAAKYAVAQQNRKKNRNIKYLGLVRANGQAVGGAMYYLTIRAIDDIDGKEKNFRAKVWLHVGGKLSLEGFKKEPKMKKSSIGRKQNKIKRPFNVFLEELRMLSEFANKHYSDVLRTASAKWRVMSDEEKGAYKKKCTDSDPQGMETQDNEADMNEDPDSQQNIILYHT